MIRWWFCEFVIPKIGEMIQFDLPIFFNGAAVLYQDMTERGLPNIFVGEEREVFCWELTNHFFFVLTEGPLNVVDAT